MSDGATLALGLAVMLVASWVAGGHDAGELGAFTRLMNGFTVLLLGAALLGIMAVLGALILKAAGVV